MHQSPILSEFPDVLKISQIQFFQFMDAYQLKKLVHQNHLRKLEVNLLIRLLNEPYQH